MTDRRSNGTWRRVVRTAGRGTPFATLFGPVHTWTDDAGPRAVTLHLGFRAASASRQSVTCCNASSRRLVEVRQEETGVLLLMFSYSFLADGLQHGPANHAIEISSRRTGPRTCRTWCLPAIVLIALLMQGYSKLGGLTSGRWIIRSLRRSWSDCCCSSGRSTRIRRLERARTCGQPARARCRGRSLRLDNAGEPEQRQSDDRSRPGDRVLDILERITDAFVSIDRDWRFIYVNDQAHRSAVPHAGHSRRQHRIGALHELERDAPWIPQHHQFIACLRLRVFVRSLPAPPADRDPPAGPPTRTRRLQHRIDRAVIGHGATRTAIQLQHRIIGAVHQEPDERWLACRSLD